MTRKLLCTERRSTRNRLSPFFLLAAAVPLVGSLSSIAHSQSTRETQLGTIVSAILPTARSVRQGDVAAVSATIINASPFTALDCSISKKTSVAANLSFWGTDPLTNAVVAEENEPLDIPPQGAQSFLLALTPTDVFGPTDVEFDFSCGNTNSATLIPGVNTLLLSASQDPVPDVIAIGAGINGDCIADIPGEYGTGVFSVASANIGAEGQITVTGDTGATALPLEISLCQTHPESGLCASEIGDSLTLDMAAGSTPTFAIFVSGYGIISFDPALYRIFVRFRDQEGVIRGETSVAVRTL